MKILVLNGPNINMLGIREPSTYGEKSYKDLLAYIKKTAKENKIKVDCHQTNYEGRLVDKIQKALGKYDGIVINPAAYTHTSIAIMDALLAVKIPCVEVHLTDVENREEFRKISYVQKACEKRFIGYGFEGYKMAMEYLISKK